MKKSSYPTSLQDIPVPSSAKVEAQLIKDLVLNPEAIGEVADGIAEEMFTKPSRQLIWRHLLKMYEAGATIDDAHVLQEVGHDYLEIVAGTTYGSALDATRHAAQLRSIAARRRAYSASVHFLQRVAAEDMHEDEVYSASEVMAEDVQRGFSLTSERPIADVMADTLKEFQARQEVEESGNLYFVPTSFPSLDAKIGGGLRPGQLVILAARPGVGKTALMVQMARAAAEAKFPVAIYSLEMSATELATRYLYATGKINAGQVARGFFDWQRIEEASGEYLHLPITVNDFSRQLPDILGRLALNVKRGLCRVAFIDYLGYIRHESQDKGANTAQRIAEITAELKNAAKRLKIPIVLLSQLNRESAKGDRAPELYDLRDSGGIEQDADIVLMLQRTQVQAEDRLIIWGRKNRAGQINFSVDVEIQNDYTKFIEYHPNF